MVRIIAVFVVILACITGTLSAQDIGIAYRHLLDRIDEFEEISASAAVTHQRWTPDSCAIDVGLDETSIFPNQADFCLVRGRATNEVYLIITTEDYQSGDDVFVIANRNGRSILISHFRLNSCYDDVSYVEHLGAQDTGTVMIVMDGLANPIELQLPDRAP